MVFATVIEGGVFHGDVMVVIPVLEGHIILVVGDLVHLPVLPAMTL